MPTYIPDSTVILEEGEYCEVCGNTEQLGSWGDKGGLGFTVCRPCWKDKARFTEWLATSFEEALAEKPDEWRKNADGTWSVINHA